MLMITSKRIKIILVSMMIGIFAFTFQIADYSKGKGVSGDNECLNMLETTTTPVSGKTIVLDAGHGTPDEGDCLLKFVV